MVELVPVVAIDGPAASGKGTVAKMLAETLGFHYLDSGLLYRTVAAEALSRELPPDDAEKMGALARELAQSGKSSTHDTARPEVAAAASCVAALPTVRAALLPIQRGRRRMPGLVADGRDMGSVVFPDAVLKVFLTAEPRERARRRQKQLEEKGIHATITDVLADLRRRDERDSAREGAPMKAFPDCIVVDSSSQVASQIVESLVVRLSDGKR